MAQYSFIDFGNKDFLRKDNGEVIIIQCSNYHEAENWLLDNGEKYGWTNEGVRYWDWDDEE